MRYSSCSTGISAVALFAATGAAQPTQLSGHYDFDCSSATLTVSTLLSGGHGSRSSVSGGELVVPVFCNNNTTYDWDDYQLRLDNAELDFNDACNSIVSNLNLPPSLEGNEMASKCFALLLMPLLIGNALTRHISGFKMSIRLQRSCS